MKIKNKKGVGILTGIIVLAIAFGVGLVVYGALFPTGITGVTAVNTSLQADTDFASARTMNNLLPLFGVLAIGLGILGYALKGFKG